MGFVISLFFLNQLIVAAIFRRNFYQRLGWLTRCVSFYCRWGARIMGIKATLSPRLVQQLKGRSALVVGNHLSYLDILILAGHMRLCFVTSVEMKETPFLGHITFFGGCLYVERRSKENLSAEIKEITRALQEGHNVVVFPEATSTNGEAVLRFRSPLFQSAIDAGAPVLPIAINYTKIDGAPVTLRNRDRVCWYGDMTFHGHFTDIITAKSIEVQVDCSPLMFPAPDQTSKDLALLAHQEVATMYRPLATID